VARREVTTLPPELVGDRRGELGRLTREELLERYGSLPGRTPEQARRTLLASTVLIDIIVWSEANRSFTPGVGGPPKA